ncbi:hypothetical protein BD626DRAFT_255519 [Schizophyllum amplum]|uniref:XLF-like N-terminal domain-containing protein n=1 Tax=Schizophyllum amplum TaxID=97359 RepID=A0A550CIL1_9AGAR|nr:hypothetical protein BD626DRAFT_255519 [Auriculariopsis ampla]
MEEFTDDRAKRLLGKEWLSKTDAQTSTPYLIKFTTDPADLSCTVIITDTKSVWAEVLLSAQFARRWRRCNAKPTSSGPLDEAEEESWRKARLELISRTHSLGAFSELSFEVVPTRYSDLAVRIEAESFIWTWETNFVGHRMSADLLSQQLIFPLISVTHIALGGQENVTDMTDGNLEKAIDKTARTARRTPDTYIRNAMAKPRVATSLQRMSAMFGFLQDPLPRIASSAEKPDLSAPDEPLRSGRHDISLRGPASGLDALSRKPLASPPRREMVSPPQIEELSPPQIEDLSPPQIEELSPPQQETPSPPQVSSPPPPAKRSFDSALLTRVRFGPRANDLGYSCPDWLPRSAALKGLASMHVQCAIRYVLLRSVSLIGIADLDGCRTSI